MPNRQRNTKRRGLPNMDEALELVVVALSECLVTADPVPGRETAIVPDTLLFSLQDRFGVIAFRHQTDG